MAIVTATAAGTAATRTAAELLTTAARPAVVIAALVCLAVAVVLGSR